MSLLATLILADSWNQWLNDWFNYPGLEIWKFVNLLIFVTAATLVMRRPLTEALRVRRDTIKQELIKAKTERDEAQLLLDEAEKLLSRLDVEVKSLKDQATQEAVKERQRLLDAAEAEIRKLELQGQREMDVAHKIAINELREFLAKRSVEIATQAIKTQMRPEDDANIIAAGLTELRRARV